MECPIWLSSIVSQLLKKEPAQRPFSAAALQLAFKEAQRRHAEGVGVLQHAAAGFSPLQLKADRDEAEKVLGIKPRKKRRRNAAPFWERPWFLVLALIGVLATIGWFLMPLSQETLRARAVRLLPPESDQWQDWNQARDAYLSQLVQRFPDGTHSEWATSQIAWIDAREYERRLKREQRMNRRTNWSDADRQYWSAWEFEEFGDLMSALDRYRALVALYGNNEQAESIVYLANEGIARIRKIGRIGSQLQDFVNRKLEEANQEVRTLRAREIWESIVELYAANQELAPQVAEAQRRLDELRPSR
jgi:hypothetical protein